MVKGKYKGKEDDYLRTEYGMVWYGDWIVLYCIVG